MAGPMKKRIVHIINGLNAIGGAELALVRLLEQRTRDTRQHEVVTLLGAERLAARLQAVDVQVTALAPQSHRLHAPVRLLRLLTAPAPALYVGWLYYGNLMASLLGVVRRVPAVWNIRHSLHDVQRSGRSTRLSIAASTRLARQPRATVYNSATSAAQHHALGWPDGRALVIPSGVDTTLFHPDPLARQRARMRLGVADDVLLLGRFGRYHPLKGYETLLQAFAALRSSRPTMLLLGGRGVDASNTALLQLVERLQLRERVQLLGECDDLQALLPALDVGVSSSHSESFPNVVTEAMACGVPCVVTNVGDSAAIVGDSGWVVDADSVTALQAGLAAALMAMNARPEACRLAARDRAASHYAVGETVLRYEQLFASVIRASEDRTEAGRSK